MIQLPATPKQMSYIKHLINRHFNDALARYQGGVIYDSYSSLIWQLLTHLGVERRGRAYPDEPTTQEASLLIDRLVKNPNQLKILYYNLTDGSDLYHITINN